ncbi:hypothetical protein ACFQZC_38705 [Streptacidiphilus monticola]
MTVLEGVAGATDPSPCTSASPATRTGRHRPRHSGRPLRRRHPRGLVGAGALPGAVPPLRGHVPHAHPEHTGADGLALLRGLLNMDDGAFHQLVAWLVAAWIPHIPHPVLTFKGEQGTGKSKTAQMVINLVDPSAATSGRSRGT